MAALEIPCPKCGQKLGLPDRNMLGRKAKCGKCGHKFILVEPEIELELAIDPQASANQTIMGMAGRWIPAPSTTPAHPASPPAASRPQAAPVTYAAPAPTPPAPVSLPIDPTFDLGISAADAGEGAVTRLKELKRRNARKRNISLAVGTVAIAGCVAAYLMMPSGSRKAKKQSHGTTAATADAEGGADEGAETVAWPTPEPVESPTHGKPIQLRHVPAGARVVINLRPAELWNPEGKGAELRACLGAAFNAWLDKTLAEQCLLEPAEIDEALICLIPASRGTPPDVSVVVHTKAEFKKTAMPDKIKGELKNDISHPYYVGGDRAYVFIDTKTFAVAPKSLAEELVNSATTPSVTADSIQELLSKTDSSRHFTLVFEPIAVRLDAEMMVPANVQPLLLSVLDWFGEDVEGVAWSFQLGDKFFSELMVRNESRIPVTRLEKELTHKLESTPIDLLQLVRRMQPNEAGKRQVIGRFPAMSKAFALSTYVDRRHRLVALQTQLPERAAPNLALGALLAWDQTTRADFGKNTPPPTGKPSSDTGPKIPIAERLKKRISVDFRDDFLYAALDFVGEETGTKFKLDGNAMKEASVTQNQKQRFKMENVPAPEVLSEIICNPKTPLVIVINEEEKFILVTSPKAAEARQLKVFPLAPAKGK